MSQAINDFFRGQEVLVTGATGFIGWHVAKKLLGAGAGVRVLIRAETPFEPDDMRGMRMITGDLLDRAALRRAMDGCRYVFHVAGAYRFWAKNTASIFEANVEGTRNLLETARELGVERSVCTSTQGILAADGPAIRDESRLAALEDFQGPYKRSKFQAWLEVARFIDEGLPVVAVLPTAPIGWRDVRPTPTGMIIVQFLNGKIPFLAPTGLNFASVEQVALGHLYAMVRGRLGERYLLGGTNLWLAQFLSRLERFAPVKAPRHCIPYWIRYLAACASEGVAEFTGREPFVTRESVGMSRSPHFASSAKAERELGYETLPIDQALDDAVRYFVARGFISGPGGHPADPGPAEQQAA